MGTIKAPSHQRSKSLGLKTSKSQSNMQVVGNMMYDTQKLRWVSLTGKYEDDPFENIDDSMAMGDSSPSPPKITFPSKSRVPSKSIIPSGAKLQRLSLPASRATSSATSSSSAGGDLDARRIECDEDYFKITNDEYKAWKFEESRWSRKVGNWFPNHDDSFKFCYELKSFLEDK
ncbi:unnamed protein product [Ambrosiozyma monospora]|uniref:Unnamed protein product n=1 Tax=Ambrosiozyma monospora TaxID=43982 RepID=A0ACB5U8I8_AMBMO|nr:unnamed protein product [Ambrosiozyma monospora]